MTLPSSGPISLSDVAGEVGDSTTSNISLGKLSVYDKGNIPLTGYSLASGFYGWADSDRTSQLQAIGRPGNTTTGNISNRMVVKTTSEPTTRLRDFNLTDSWSINFWIKADWSVSGTNQLKNQGRYIYLLGTAANAVHPTFNRNIYNNNLRIFFDSQNNRMTAGFLSNDSSGNPKYKQNQWYFHNSGDIQTAAGLGTSSTSTAWWSATNRGNTNANGFNMITFRYDGSSSWTNTNPRLYWNGVYCGAALAPQGNGTPVLDTTSARGISFIGTPFSPSSGTFDAAAGYYGGNTGTTIIDRVSFFGKSLTAAEMTALYNSGTPNGIPTDDSDLIAYYSFNTNTENIQAITDPRPVFPVKQGTAGYGGVELDGSSDFETGTDQSEPSILISFSYDAEGNTNTYIGACSAEATEDTAYHDGSGTYPAVNDHVYTNSAGTTSVTAGYYKQGNGRWFRIALSGSVLTVTQIGEC